MNQLQIKYQSEIEEIVKASNLIAQKGYVTSQGGNLSYKVDENVILITPTKVAKGDITPKDIVMIDFDGNVLCAAHGRRPTGETPFHLHILKKRPDFNALVHAHPAQITALAIAHSELLSRPLLPEPIIEVGPVLSVDYKEPLSQELADAFDPVIDKSNAFLMKNHGILLGSYEGINRAVELLDMIEATALSTIGALTIGNIVEVPKNEIEKLDNVIKTRNLPMPGLPGVNKSLIDLYF